MLTPEKLSTALIAARNSIAQDGELFADSRKKLLDLIEELSAVEHSNAGYLRRSRLAFICAQKSLLIIKPYEEVFDFAQLMLSRGRTALLGKYNLKFLEKDNGEFHTEVNNLFEHGEDAFASVYAGMACFSAINTILYDADFESIGQYEKNISPDDWSACFYASLAVSGSAVWENKNGSHERLRYWHWYLDNAIPWAWNVELDLTLPNE